MISGTLVRWSLCRRAHVTSIGTRLEVAAWKQCFTQGGIFSSELFFEFYIQSNLACFEHEGAH